MADVIELWTGDTIPAPPPSSAKPLTDESERLDWMSSMLKRLTQRAFDAEQRADLLRAQLAAERERADVAEHKHVHALCVISQHADNMLQELQRMRCELARRDGVEPKRCFAATKQLSKDIRTLSYSSELAKLIG